MGVVISIIIIVLWIFNLIYSLSYVNINLFSFSFYFHFLLQIFLFTGLFITGHDVMHNAISSNRIINKLIGYISSFLFAGLSYKKLVNNHIDSSVNFIFNKLNIIAIIIICVKLRYLYIKKANHKNGF